MLKCYNFDKDRNCTSKVRAQQAFSTPFPESKTKQQTMRANHIHPPTGTPTRSTRQGNTMGHSNSPPPLLSPDKEGVE